ncbi:hypothetical protein Dimus_012581 [Dionaea muscipula]
MAGNYHATVAAIHAIWSLHVATRSIVARRVMTMMKVAAQEAKPLLATFGCPRPVPLLAGACRSVARRSAARCVLLPTARSCCLHRHRATATRSLELLFAARRAAVTRSAAHVVVSLLAASSCSQVKASRVKMTKVLAASAAQRSFHCS